MLAGGTGSAKGGNVEWTGGYSEFMGGGDVHVTAGRGVQGGRIALDGGRSESSTGGQVHVKSGATAGPRTAILRSMVYIFQRGHLTRTS